MGNAQEFTFPILDDDILEDSETIEISATSSPGGAVSRVNVVILDNDLTFVDDTPTVIGNSIFWVFSVNPLVASAECQFTRELPIDCEY